MSKRPNLIVNLVSIGHIASHLHYGINSKEWWNVKNDSDPKIGALLYPKRVGWETYIEQNNRKFYLQITERDENGEILPGYRCRSENEISNIETSPTKAITSLYRKIFPNSSTNFSGPLVIGWENDEFLKNSLNDIDFRPFAIKVDKLLVYVTNIGIGEEVHDIGARVGYTASITGEVKKKRAIFIQTVESQQCKIVIYQKDIEPKVFLGSTPLEVWKKTNLFKKFNGFQLFGLEHPMTQKILLETKVPKCTPVSWNNEKIMNEIFNYHLKKRTISDIDWEHFFQSWQQQKSPIIELHGKLKKLYPINYLFDVRELRAWRAMLRATGCSEITPFSIDKSECEFWSCNSDPLVDQNTLEILYHDGLLNSKPKKIIDASDRFWECFQKTLKENQTGYDGKIRMLSIIASDFEYEELEQKLKHQIIAELESIQRHLKREYEKELDVDCLGHTYHVECLEHCLPYAFGECTEPHLSKCNQCNKISEMFYQLKELMPNDIERIDKNRNKLQHYWSHQARKLGNNVSEGENIVEAIKVIKGTSVANINPDRSYKERKKPTISGISSWFEFQWPVEGELAGFVCARSLPNFGEWNNFSPDIIRKSMKGGEQHRPNPLISTHTKPECQWITPIPSTALLTNAISYLLVSGIGLNRLKKVDIKEKLKQRGLEYNEKDDRSELTEILKADITKARLKKKIEGAIEISNITESDNKERSKKRIKLSLTQSDGKEISQHKKAMAKRQQNNE
nr:12107_t:CDS:2 [Entrophospora candida]